MRIRNEVKLPVDQLKTLRSLLRQLNEERLEPKARFLVTKVTTILCERPQTPSYE